MRLAWLTDVHFDHADDAAIDALFDSLTQAAPEGLLLTGDISVAKQLPAHLGMLVERLGLPTWFVLGNHDYWGTRVEPLREAMRRISEVEPRLCWLGGSAPVRLSDDTVLIGVDGWADARHGDVEGTPIRLNDYRFVEDLLKADWQEALEAARAIADADAARLADALEAASALASHVLIATHVPPFVQSARFDGQVSHPHWLPWMTNKAVGDTLSAAAARHPNTQFDVLCGHMHYPSDERIEPNLRVRCGAAEYRNPAIVDVLTL